MQHDHRERRRHGCRGLRRALIVTRLVLTLRENALVKTSEQRRRILNSDEIHTLLQLFAHRIENLVTAAALEKTFQFIFSQHLF